MHIKRGTVFSRLTVVREAGRSPQGRSLWACTCICGGSKTVSGTNLRSGYVRSCGCLAKELASARAKTHGLSKTLTYSSWITMLHRCENPRRSKYEYHGGRGITVCKRWHKFENFLADMGPRESVALSLERRDNNKGYRPSNCYWATREEQCNNRRNSVRLTHAGKTQTLSQWAAHLGKTQSTLSWRYHQGWPVSEVLYGRNS